MKSDAFTLPSGQSLRTVRDFLRRHNAFSNTEVARHFGADIANDLIAHGLIEPWEQFQGHFRASSLGLRLANVRLLPRIDRAKAQGIVDAFLERVRQVNARADLLYRVPRVHAFGSFITGEPVHLCQHPGVQFRVLLFIRWINARLVHDYAGRLFSRTRRQCCDAVTAGFDP